MTDLSKRSTVYFDPAIHQALRLRATTTETSVSALVDEAVRQMMLEDMEDLSAFAERGGEAEISSEVLLAKLKRHGKL